MRDDPKPDYRHSLPVKLYRTDDRIVVAAPMPGLQPEDITVRVTASGRLILEGGPRGVLRSELFFVQTTDPDEVAGGTERWQESKEVLRNEWSAGGYCREVDLGHAVDADEGTVTYGNGVLVVALPIAEQMRPARLALSRVGQGRGEYVGGAGHPLHPVSVSAHP